MNKANFCTYLLLLLTLMTSAQSVSQKFDVSRIGLKWELLNNHYKGNAQCLTSVTIDNNGASAFPASGWKIYFNYIREIFPGSVTGQVSIDHVNGDIFVLSPKPSFGGIQPGQALKIEFVSGEPVLNVSDPPSGWYIVWDDRPEVGISLTPIQLVPITDTTIAFVDPPKRYSLNAHTEDLPVSRLPKIYPTPQQYQEEPGAFTITRQTEISSDTAFINEASYLADELKTLLGKKPFISSGQPGKRRIFIHRSDGPIESYKLIVNNEEVRIEASSPAGAFYGIQSLLCLVPPEAWSGLHSSLKIPAVLVSDKPRFGFRSLMLDVARNFQTKKELFRVLDLMAMNKLNVLHLHFSDDEGWRVEMPSLPELTDVGAKRGHTLDSKHFLPASFAGGPDTSGSFGTGYYTKEDFVDILEYADKRHIQVIPEVECPGHARAAIKAMDARYRYYMDQGKRAEAEEFLLRDLNDSSQYRGAQLWNDNVICVGLPSVYHFLARVADDLIAMYAQAGLTLTTIHFGGDEVPAGVWEKSPVCRSLIERGDGPRNTDDLWYYFYGHLDSLVKDRHLYLSGWEEVGMRKTLLDGHPTTIPNPEFACRQFRLHVWNNMIGWGNEDLPYRLANAGYKVVLSCVSNQYFDLSYNKEFEEPGYYWGGFVDIDKPFNFIPFDYYRNSNEDRLGNPVPAGYFKGKERLTDYGKSNIVGIQGLLWSENIHGPDPLEYMVLPKLQAMAERAWSPDPDWVKETDTAKSRVLYLRAWSVFVNVLGKRILPRLDSYNGGYLYRIPPPGVVLQDGKLVANMQIPGLILTFTSDGSEPTAKSKHYTTALTSKGHFKFRLFDSHGRGGRIVSVTNP